MRWGGHACDATIFAVEHRLNIFRRKFVLAYLDQRSDNAAAHLVEKTIAFDHER